MADITANVLEVKAVGANCKIGGISLPILIFDMYTDKTTDELLAVTTIRYQMENTQAMMDHVRNLYSVIPTLQNFSVKSNNQITVFFPTLETTGISTGDYKLIYTLTSTNKNAVIYLYNTASSYMQTGTATPNSTSAYRRVPFFITRLNGDSRCCCRVNMSTLANWLGSADITGDDSIVYKEGFYYAISPNSYFMTQPSSFAPAADTGLWVMDEDLITPVITTRDPYANGGESEPGGGDGNFDFSSTDIPIPGLPNIGATDTGFISLYKPSAQQLKSLANYMWAGAFDITQFKKLFADPMDAILGLHIIPTTAAHPASGSASLVIGNIDTGLTMPTCTEQYYEADMGEITIPAKWGAYLDYSPYTKLSLYLPYIGFIPLSADDCMRGSIKVVYHVDVLSGTCMAFVYCVSNRGADGHTLYMFNGSCSCDCPVTSGQYRSALEGLLGIAGSIGRVAAGDVAGGLKDAVSNVTSMLKPEIGRSGSFGGSGGLMGIQYPYLVLTVPRMAIPGQQNTFIGYPSFVTKTIGDLTGYCSIDVTHLNNMPCTQAETDEIISLLGEGVIL